MRKSANSDKKYQLDNFVQRLVDLEKMLKNKFFIVDFGARYSRERAPTSLRYNYGLRTLGVLVSNFDVYIFPF